MGMFDIIFVDCPNCGAAGALEFQSKSGPCVLAHYTPEDVPEEVLTGVHRDYASRCKKCGKSYYPKVVRRPVVVKYTLSLLEHPLPYDDENKDEGVDTRTDADKALEKGINRVYRKYGNNLLAFLRDAGCHEPEKGRESEE